MGILFVLYLLISLVFIIMCTFLYNKENYLAFLFELQQFLHFFRYVYMQSFIHSFIRLFSDTNNEASQFRGNKYWTQVNLDVDRSHRRFPHGNPT